MKILFGVFDWGLGHATRDIPLIAALLEEHEVHILSTGRALTLLKAHFGDRCVYYDVPSVHAPYTRTRLFKLRFSLLAPRMIRDLRRARRKSKAIIRGRFDKVISDCRYDVYDTPENSYLINHQLRFKTPPGAERLLEKWLAARMRMYRYVLVPDYEDRNLTGVLSHDLRYIPREKVKYIGILSRLQKRDVPQDIDCFVSLSGPEPQRRMLEERILAQVQYLRGTVVIAGGRPETPGLVPQTTRDRRPAATADGNVEYYGFLDAGRQEEMMNRAKSIITRSGYTTMMELVELDKTRVLLLPTPGQTEQEYLADYCEGRDYFHHVSQYRLRLPGDLADASSGRGFTAPWKTCESVARFREIVCSSSCRA
jgi:predicted glycosyltransferase